VLARRERVERAIFLPGEEVVFFPLVAAERDVLTNRAAARFPDVREDERDLRARGRILDARVSARAPLGTVSSPHPNSRIAADESARAASARAASSFSKPSAACSSGICGALSPSAFLTSPTMIP
jgi:hypothetical protein